jgi:hypothetical protein
MAGFIYRRAVAIREFGERHNLPWLVRLGLWIRERVIKLPVKYFG